MINDKLISIIIPVYNSEKTLDRCITSIINQSYKNLEIIIVNDGSTDGSLEICQKYSKFDNRINTFNQCNKGVGSSRNLGLNSCKGEYILFIDSDDLIEENYIKTLYQSAILTDADIIESGARVILNNNVQIYPYEKNEKISIYNNKMYCESYLNFESNVSVWGKLFKRELIGDTRFIDLNINEDFIFSWSILKKTKIYCENLYTNYTYYLDKQDSLSKQPFNKSNMSMLYYINNVVNDIKEKYPEMINQAISHYSACLLHNLILYLNYLKNCNCYELYEQEKNQMIEASLLAGKINRNLLLHESEFSIDNVIDQITCCFEKIKNKKL